jgi:hypothetical protein
MTAPKKGISAQMHRMLSVTYKTAWFMMHRLRGSMRTTARSIPMGGMGKIVKPTKPTSVRRKAPAPTSAAARARTRFSSSSSVAVPPACSTSKDVQAATLRDIIVRHIDRQSALMTD